VRVSQQHVSMTAFSCLFQLTALMFTSPTLRVAITAVLQLTSALTNVELQVDYIQADHRVHAVLLSCSCMSWS
jgi:hypothetical protein